MLCTLARLVVPHAYHIPPHYHPTDGHQTSNQLSKHTIIGAHAPPVVPTEAEPAKRPLRHTHTIPYNYIHIDTAQATSGCANTHKASPLEDHDDQRTTPAAPTQEPQNRAILAPQRLPRVSPRALTRSQFARPQSPGTSKPQAPRISGPLQQLRLFHGSPP